MGKLLGSMEALLSELCAHAESAHWWFLGMLLLAGLNVPLSEDIILIMAGAVTSTCIPDHAARMLFWLYVGCWFSAWEAYTIGRFLGPKLYDIRWFSHVLNPHRIDRLHHYIEKFGILTFILGRFIPGGVRNALFMTCGLGKMPFLRFIARDGIACLFSTCILFYLGYKAGENAQLIIAYFKKYELFIILTLVVTVSGIIIWFNRKRAQS